MIKYIIMTRSIALYGLSANPIHKEHLTIIRGLSDNFDEVYVWAVDNPDKYGSPNYLDLSIRDQMVTLAVEEAKLNNVKVTSQWSHPETGTSIQKLRAYYPNEELWIALGSDSIKSISSWSGAEGMVLATGFVEINRPGITPGPSSHQIAGQMMPVKTLNIQTKPYSSTLVRNKCLNLEEERLNLLEMLPVSVFDLIKAKHLYQV